MKVGIIRFPGSNCDEDAWFAVVEHLRERAIMLWHKDHDLQGADVVILPGGFSYGDYLRAGAIARFSPIMREVAAHAQRGGIVIGAQRGPVERAQCAGAGRGQVAPVVDLAVGKGGVGQGGAGHPGGQ